MYDKPGWTYSHCNSLGMQIAINDTSGVLYTEDKICYTAVEAALFKPTGYEIPVEVHLIKKAFNGTVISIEG